MTVRLCGTCADNGEVTEATHYYDTASGRRYVCASEGIVTGSYRACVTLIGDECECVKDYDGKGCTCVPVVGRALAAEGLLCMGNTPYSGSAFRCEADNGQPADAVHTWEGRHYCAYHSPFDVTEEERVEMEIRKDGRTDEEWAADIVAEIMSLSPVCRSCGSRDLSPYVTTPPPAHKGDPAIAHQGTICNRCKLWAPNS